MSEVNRLEWEAFIRDSELMQTAQRIERRVGGMVEQVGKKGKDMETVFAGMAKAATAFFTISSAQQFIQQLVSVRSEFQQLEIAFTTMLGSKEKADKLTQDLVQFASTTPFGMKDTANAAKQLLAYGSSASSVKDELRMLGDVASGVSQPIGDLVYLYGTLRTQGRAYLMDIRQFAGRGIPIYKELAKVLQVSESQVNSFVESGKVGFAEVQKAFQNMTATGSMFGGLMEAQSKTIQGELERLGDGFDLMLNKIGQSSQGTISSIIQSLSGLVENFDKVLGIITVMISTYGVYRAAVMATVAAETVRSVSLLGMSNSIKGLTALEMLHYGALVIKTKAQAALNAVMMTNPYVAVATVLAALIATMMVFNDTISASEKAHNRFIDGNNQAAQSLENLKSKTSELVAVIRDSNTSQYQSNQEYSKLQALYPHVLGNISKETFLKRELTSVQKELNTEQDRKFIYNIGQRLESSKKQIEELIKQQKTYQEAMSSGKGGGEGLGKAYAEVSERLKASRIEAEMLTQEYNKQTREYEFANMSQEEKVNYLEKQRNEILKQIDFVKKNNSQFSEQFGVLGNVLQKSEQIGSSFSGWTLLNFQKQLNDVEVKLRGLNSENDAENVVRSENWINEQIKKLKELRQEQELNSIKWKEYNGKIEKLENELSDALGKNKKSQQSAVNETYKAQERYLDIIKDISRTQEEFHRSRLSENQQEIESIKAKYKVLREKIDEFNRDPRNKKQRKFVDPKQVSLLEKEEIDYAVERQNNSKKLKLYQEDLESYNKYQDVKRSTDEETADRLLGKYKNVYQDIQKEIDSLEEKKANKTISPVEEAYLKSLSEMQKEHLKGVNDETLRSYLEALKMAETFGQKELKIRKDHADALARLGKDATQEQKAVLEKSLNDQLTALIESSPEFEKAMKDIDESSQLLLEKSFKTGKTTIMNLIDGMKDATEDQKNALKKIFGDFFDKGIKDSKLGNYQAVESMANAFGDLVKSSFQFADNIQDGLSSLSQMIGSAGQLSGLLGTFLKNDSLKNLGGGLGVAGSVVGIVSSIAGFFSSKQEESNKRYYVQMQTASDLQLKMTESITKALQRQVDLLNEIYGAERLEKYAKSLSEIESNWKDINNQLEGKFQMTGDAYTDDILKKLNLGFSRNDLTRGMAPGSTKYMKTMEVWANAKNGVFSKFSKLPNDIKSASAELERLAKLIDSDKADAPTVELYNQLKESMDLYKQLTNKLKEEITGTSFSSLLENSTNLFFNSGEDAATAWSKGFQNIMRDFVKNQFKREFLELEMQKFYDKYDELAKDGLTAEESKYLKSVWDDIEKRGKEKLENLQKDIDVDLNDKGKDETLSGKIRREISEQTGSEIVGLSRAQFEQQKLQAVLMQDSNKIQANLLTIANNKLVALNAIQVNTANTVLRLDTAVGHLAQIVKNTTGTSGRSAEGMGL